MSVAPASLERLELSTFTLTQKLPHLTYLTLYACTMDPESLLHFHGSYLALHRIDSKLTLEGWDIPSSVTCLELNGFFGNMPNNIVVLRWQKFFGGDLDTFLNSFEEIDAHDHILLFDLGLDLSRLNDTTYSTVFLTIHHKFKNALLMVEVSIPQLDSNRCVKRKEMEELLEVDLTSSILALHSLRRRGIWFQDELLESWRQRHHLSQDVVDRVKKLFPKPTQ
eukprot:TRINITY_DN9265_c1_g2_i2.p1 TRINITY_DN9265_c1_g2~~TRINITY_DN9265_c1_g2_i2.p1  ORF type:complete len:223 (-),score=24.72 TRINITY_DN9265_c1_g2_i2:25-693(-)